MSQKVYVGMSGGVDSSVSALLLKRLGYDVTGVFMKNWTRDLPGFKCPWQEDYNDAKRVAYQLKIPFKVFDFEHDYYDLVVKYMLEALADGLTPNPDVMCNQEIKFKLFLNLCIESGADMIATGHYAATQADQLYKPLDANKDQTYFLYRIKSSALAKTIFPLAELTKPAVRQIAKEANLVVASKKDSQGICFVGEVGLVNFIKSQLGEQSPGPIINQETQQVLGYHAGAIFYTIGQRHGLNIGGGLPYYVVGKDMPTNTVYVTNNLNSDLLWKDNLEITKLFWINQPPISTKDYTLKCRYRGEEVITKIEFIKNSKNAKLKLNEPIKALTPGQSAVIYEDKRVVGGGIII